MDYKSSLVERDLIYVKKFVNVSRLSNLGCNFVTAQTEPLVCNLFKISGLTVPLAPIETILPLSSDTQINIKSLNELLTKFPNVNSHSSDHGNIDIDGNGDGCVDGTVDRSYVFGLVGSDSSLTYYKISPFDLPSNITTIPQ
eukprot:TRINITY_DN7198_c0_g1_i2.p1 TRINITY_DN7198_c0_g1~~TRINITY_DN7198_c0_g1_i2.p1  ORF type:complete len:157 (-),score=20.14 TRINITY_DN7198_c0_g1_i2:28-453(-)